MDNWITELMMEFGYLGVFFLILLENVFPPIPSEIILSFGGFMTTQTDLTVRGVIASATIGSVAGAVILYFIGRLLNTERIESIIDRYGHILRVNKEDIYKAEQWFLRYGFWTVFFCRMVPLVRSLISIPAGMSRMNFPIFLLFTALGTLIWNTVIVSLGAKVGDSWDSIVYYLDIYSNLVYVILAVIGVAVIVYLIKRNGKRTK